MFAGQLGVNLKLDGMRANTTDCRVRSELPRKKRSLGVAVQTVDGLGGRVYRVSIWKNVFCLFSQSKSESRCDTRRHRFPTQADRRGVKLRSRPQTFCVLPSVARLEAIASGCIGWNGDVSRLPQGRIRARGDGPRRPFAFAPCTKPTYGRCGPKGVRHLALLRTS